MTEAGAIIILVNFLGVIGIWIKAYFDYRARKTNNNPGNPGNHGERIATLETDMKNVKEDIKEIKEKLNRKR